MSELLASGKQQRREGGGGEGRPRGGGGRGGPHGGGERGTFRRFNRDRAVERASPRGSDEPDFAVRLGAGCWRRFAAAGSVP